MTEYLTVLLTYTDRFSAQDWALASSALFAVLICRRMMRMLRKAKVHEARLEAEEAQVAAAPAPVEPHRPAPSPMRPRVVASSAPNFAPTVEETPPPANVAAALAKVNFAAKPMMPWEQYCLQRDIEAFLNEHSAGHRLFSKVLLSDAFGVNKSTQMSDELAQAVDRALTPFKLDFLILDRHGMPSLAVHLGQANPVIYTVLDKAGVPLLELPKDYSWVAVEEQLFGYFGAPLQPIRSVG